MHMLGSQPMKNIINSVKAELEALDRAIATANTVSAWASGKASTPDFHYQATLTKLDSLSEAAWVHQFSDYFNSNIDKIRAEVHVLYGKHQTGQATTAHCSAGASSGNGGKPQDGRGVRDEGENVASEQSGPSASSPSYEPSAQSEIGELGSTSSNSQIGEAAPLPADQTGTSAGLPAAPPAFLSTRGQFYRLGNTSKGTPPNYVYMPYGSAEPSTSSPIYESSTQAQTSVPSSTTVRPLIREFAGLLISRMSASASSPTAESSSQAAFDASSGTLPLLSVGEFADLSIDQARPSASSPVAKSSSQTAFDAASTTSSDTLVEPSATDDAQTAGSTPTSFLQDFLTHWNITDLSSISPDGELAGLHEALQRDLQGSNHADDFLAQYTAARRQFPGERWVTSTARDQLRLAPRIRLALATGPFKELVDVDELLRD